MREIAYSAAGLVLWLASIVTAQEQIASKSAVDSLGDSLPPDAVMRLGTIRWRPGGSIGHVSFSPDGERLVSWNDEIGTTFVLWDAATGRELLRRASDGAPLGPIQWLANGRARWCDRNHFLNELSDEKVDSKNEVSFKVIALADFGDGVRAECSAISPDGKCLAGCKPAEGPDAERDLWIWDVENVTKIEDMPKPRRLGTVPGRCKSLFFSPDGRRIVALCQLSDKKPQNKKCLVTVIDAVTGKEVRRIDAPTPLSQGQTVAVSTKSLAMGLGDEDGTVLIWDLEKADDRRLKTGHGKRKHYPSLGVSAVAFSHDEKTLITAGRDSAVRTWDASTLKLQRTIADAHSSWIETLSVTRDGKHLACAGQNGVIRHWNLKTGACLDPHVVGRQWISSVQIARDAATAFSVSGDGRLSIWNTATGQERRFIALPETTHFWPDVALARDGNTLVVSAGDKLCAWNAISGERLKLPEACGNLDAGLVSFSDDGKTLVAIHEGSVALVDWPAGTIRKRFAVPEPEHKPNEVRCNAAALSQDGRWLATMADRYWYREEGGNRTRAGGDSIVDLWNAETGERIHRLVEGGVGRTLRFTADGDLLYGSGRRQRLRDGSEVISEGELQLIDPRTGRLKREFEKPPTLENQSTRYCMALGISPDGGSIYSAGNDGVIHVYETATGKVRRSLSRHRGYITSLAISGDGRRLVTGSHDLTALVWDITLVGRFPSGKASPNATEQARLWEQLAESDARAAYAAMATFAAHSNLAVAAIRAEIKPARPGPTEETLDRLYADLDSDKFATRDRAARELDELGERAVAGMRARLAKSPTLETRRRIEQFLDQHDPATIAPRYLREVRALEVLEQLDDAECRSLLAELAGGARDARLTRAAIAALARRK